MESKRDFTPIVDIPPMKIHLNNKFTKIIQKSPMTLGELHKSIEEFVQVKVLKIKHHANKGIFKNLRVDTTKSITFSVAYQDAEGSMFGIEDQEDYVAILELSKISNMLTIIVGTEDRRKRKHNSKSKPGTGIRDCRQAIQCIKDPESVDFLTLPRSDLALEVTPNDTISTPPRRVRPWSVLERSAYQAIASMDEASLFEALDTFLLQKKRQPTNFI